jgi:hypothetical protein
MGLAALEFGAILRQLLGAPFAALMPLSEHPRVVAERLRLPLDNSPEIAVIGIEQAVVFGGGKDRWHKQQTMFLPLRELITKADKRRRSCGIEPVSRKRAEFDPFRTHLIRNLSDSQNKVVGRVVLIYMAEILQHGQRLMLGRIAQTDPGARPASSVAIRTLPVKRIPGVSLPPFPFPPPGAEHPIKESQLIPP